MCAISCLSYAIHILQRGLLNRAQDKVERNAAASYNPVLLSTWSIGLSRPDWGFIVLLHECLTMWFVGIISHSYLTRNQQIARRASSYVLFTGEFWTFTIGTLVDRAGQIIRLANTINSLALQGDATTSNPQMTLKAPKCRNLICIARGLLALVPIRISDGQSIGFISVQRCYANTLYAFANKTKPLRSIWH